jgi:hypothetical protein
VYFSDCLINQLKSLKGFQQDTNTEGENVSFKTKTQLWKNG